MALLFVVVVVTIIVIIIIHLPLFVLPYALKLSNVKVTRVKINNRQKHDNVNK